LKGDSPADASAQSGGSRSKEAKETGASPTGGEVGDGSGSENSGAEAKIQGGVGAKERAEERADVEQHNREFERRHDRAQPAEDDKVDKKFWEGQGGADKES
jgi:hypothetical protein